MNSCDSKEYDFMNDFFKVSTVLYTCTCIKYDMETKCSIHCKIKKRQKNRDCKNPWLTRIFSTSLMYPRCVVKGYCDDLIIQRLCTLPRDKIPV